MSVTNVTDTLEYQDFINSFIGDKNYSDPHLTARIEAGESLDDMIAKKAHHCFVTDDSGEITGLHNPLFKVKARGASPVDLHLILHLLADKICQNMPGYAKV